MRFYLFFFFNRELSAKTDDRLTESLDRTLNVHRRVTVRKHKPITNIVINNIRPNTKYSCCSFRANHNYINSAIWLIVCSGTLLVYYSPALLLNSSGSSVHFLRISMGMQF